MVSVTSPRTLRAFPMTGVISALPANHRLGGSLENLILKISSRVNARRCLWGKLLSSMIRYRLNVTIAFITPEASRQVKYKFNLKNTCPDYIFTCPKEKKNNFLYWKLGVPQYPCSILATVISWSFKVLARIYLLLAYVSYGSAYVAPCFVNGVWKLHRTVAKSSLKKDCKCIGINYI